MLPFVRSARDGPRWFYLGKGFWLCVRKGVVVGIRARAEILARGRARVRVMVSVLVPP